MAQCDGVDDDVGIYTLRACRTFAGAARECREARLWARRHMRPFPDVADAVELVVSEFFGNAVRHTASGQPGGTVFVSLVGLVSGALHLEVHDEGPRRGAPRTTARVLAPDLERPDGRGLFLAAALTKEWGRLPLHGGPGYAERGYTSIFDPDLDHETSDYVGPMITWAEFSTSFRAAPASAAAHHAG
ncbi:ATP-binding protein [Streptomonospora nanhaiensis]|uniref:Anti-sigma regulatory factor (Ser/Thr protein kinase) n=1 Tax=Streptomonospora nanhaiensis TaxID=1323731 RepID=A0A853BRY5_9ACTN|nr:ATP-binding protein [Streptomonospora nanhaiensis]MBV2364918.1 ATP-binding protein [Streptomonospora nanhaiensis]MBX9391109.1 ATP-binding protein [Streptomonospora nanhaiensis]NYI97261.1 anti-sigma regulatory factor (Ser/Thr protein kinase) [Streptomonospora nanhaiensis]